MIDDKKIEKAARNYINTNGYFIKYDGELCAESLLIRMVQNGLSMSF